RHSGKRILHVRRNFSERLEHKAALTKSRVRHDQSRFVDRGIPEQYEVEIEAARRVRIRTCASPLRFNRQKALKQLARRHCRLADCRTVQKKRLRTRRAHGSGVAKARDAQTAQQGAEASDCVLKVGGPVAEIRSESNGDYPVIQ